MTEQAYIFELGEQSFATSAILNSHKLPVLVEFMGVWSGPCVAMAAKVTALFPEIPILYMSGYPELANGHQEILGQGRLLQKPFELANLTRQVRRL